MRKLSYEKKIDDVYDSIYKKIEEQKNSVIDIKRMINNVEGEMISVYKNIA